MPIIISCPGCPTKLSAPDGAAGKHVRCPKCGAITPVPAFIPVEEVPVVEAAIAPQKPKPKPFKADEDEEPPRKKKPQEDEEERPRKKKRRAYDDDDDYEHDHPRRKSRRAAGGGSGMIIVITLGGLLLLGGIGLGIYLL